MDVFSLIRFIFVLFVITFSSAFLFCHSVLRSFYYLLKNIFTHYPISIADVIFCLCEGEE